VISDPPSYQIVTSAEALSVLARRIQEADVIGIDIETTSLDPRDGRIRFVQVALPDAVHIIDLDRVALTQEFLDALSAARPVKVIQNAKFEAKWFLHHHDITLHSVFDTMLASQVLAAGVPVKHDLASVVRRYLKVDLDKSEQRSDWSRELRREQLDYAAADVAHLLPLREALIAQLRGLDLLAVAQLESDLAPVVAAMELAGIAFDRDAWQAQARENEVGLRTIERRLADALPGENGKPINPRSPKQILAATKRLGISLPDTEERTLAQHAGQHDAVRLLLDHRAAQKAVSSYGLKYLRHVREDTGRIHAEYDPLKRTGRFSCSKPNLQQVPRDTSYRRCFVPAPGMVFVRADYSQLEVRVAAELSQDHALIDVFRAGGDVHRKTASLILQKDEAGVSDHERQAAKAVSFGLLFGQSAEGLVGYARSQYGVELSLKEAELYRKGFFGSYSTLHEYLLDQVRNGFATREVRTTSGRLRRLLPGKNGKINPREAMNTPIQGTSADGMKQAMVLLHPRLAPLGARILLCVHDELLVEAPEDRIEEVKGVVVAGMIEGMSVYVKTVPIEVESSIRPTWASSSR
jgi:DNA polymerase I-like protein with 3'-5' exonuclease and polymerase domains